MGKKLVVFVVVKIARSRRARRLIFSAIKNRRVQRLLLRVVRQVISRRLRR